MLESEISLKETSEHEDVVLATFETSAKELLFPYPQLRGPYCAGVDVDLLMEPTKDFPGIISPKVQMILMKGPQINPAGAKFTFSNLLKCEI